MAPPATIQLPFLTVKVKGPLHIGTGFSRGLVNRTVVQGSDGFVRIPGSTLKGKVRSACEALAQLYEMSDCRAPRKQRMKCMSPGRGVCPVCAMFGAPGKGSSLFWLPALLSEDWQAVLKHHRAGKTVLGQTSIRTQVQMSRTRGIAREAHLFTSEFALEGLVFQAEPGVIGRMALTRMTSVDNKDVYYELVLLLAGIRMVMALGGGKSRAAGECEIELPKQVIVNGRGLDVEDQLEHLEELCLYKDESGELQ